MTDYGPIYPDAVYRFDLASERTSRIAGDFGPGCTGEGGPADSTLFYTLYLYQEAFTSFQMGYAAAMAWALLAMIAAATAVAFISSRYWVFYGDADR